MERNMGGLYVAKMALRASKSTDIGTDGLFTPKKNKLSPAMAALAHCWEGERHISELLRRRMSDDGDGFNGGAATMAMTGDGVWYP